MCNLRLLTELLLLHLGRDSSILAGRGPPAREEVSKRSGGVLDVLVDNLPRRPLEDEIDLLEGLVLGLGHEEDLVDPADGGDATVEAQGQAGLAHGALHG